MIVTWVVGLLGAGVIAYLWYKGHPDLIDRGDAPGNERAFWNAHSKLHIGGAAATAFLPALADGFLAGLLLSVVLWTLVEVAQTYPRDKQGGFFEKADLVWDVVGAFIGAWFGSLIGALLWR